jgi:hypothetical protein
VIVATVSLGDHWIDRWILVAKRRASTLEPLMHQRRRTSTAAALAGACLLACSPGAHAAAPVLPVDIDALPRAGAVESGQAVVRLSSGARTALKTGGATLAGSGEVKVKGSSIQLLADPEADAWIDPTTMKGSVGIDGSLSIKGRSGTAKLTKITFSPGLARKVTATLGKKVITLGKLSGGKASFSKQADGLLKNAKLSISAGGAKAVNKVTGGGLSAGTFGSVMMSVTTRELPLASGAATLTLDPAVLQLIESNGFDLQPEAPATRSGNVVTIPLVAGAFDPTELTGRLKFDGKLHFENAATGKGVDLFGFRASISATQKDLYAQISESVTPVLGNLDLSGVEAGLNGKLFRATGSKLYFSQVAVSTLKQSFGVTVAKGQLLGTVDVTGTISGTF